MTNTYGAIAQNIKKYRKNRSMSQESLAAAAGLSKNYISLIETGQEKIGMRAFIRIKDALGVSASQLFGEQN